MNKLTMIISVCTLLLVQSIFAQEPPKSPKATAEGKGVKITYGQPSKRGRVIFGELVPFGQVWRTGANEATQITFDKDATFAGKDVKAGTYTLFTIPNKDKWTIILNSKLGQWGAYDYDKNKASNVLTADVPVTTASEMTEKLTLSFDDKGLNIVWDMTKVIIPVSVKM
ncbi:MAG: DUF2911 domain-containing protein [Bacteroidota bacterium]|nr:DUF2911 domain-containing protein [Bacteroidota bacterium]